MQSAVKALVQESGWGHLSLWLGNIASLARSVPCLPPFGPGQPIGLRLRVGAALILMSAPGRLLVKLYERG